MTLSFRTQVWIAGAAVLALLALEFLDPLPQPALSITRLTLLAGLTIWGVLRCRRSSDEVVRAANRASMAWGAPIGIMAAVLFTLAVRYFQPATDLVSGFAASSSSQISIGPAAVGFGLGVAFVSLLVGFSVLVTWALWWLARR